MHMYCCGGQLISLIWSYFVHWIQKFGYLAYYTNLCTDGRALIELSCNDFVECIFCLFVSLQNEFSTDCLLFACFFLCIFFILFFFSERVIALKDFISASKWSNICLCVCFRVQLHWVRIIGKAYTTATKFKHIHHTFCDDFDWKIFR